MANWFHGNPRGFALAVMVILAMGISAFNTIGRQEDPTITNYFANVFTAWPGADPARVEALVTERIEAELRGIGDIAEIRSVSRAGLSVVSLELSDALDPAGIESAWTDVRNALDDAAAGLPAGVLAPRFDDAATGTYTAIVALTQRAGDPADPALLSRMAAEAQDRFRKLPGTELVRVFGAAQEEILVGIDPVALAGLGLTAAEVAARVAAADAKVQAGAVRGQASDLVIEVAGAFEDLERVRAIPLATGRDGALVRLGDIATVGRAVASPPASLAYLDGAPAVLIGARMDTGLRVDRWMAGFAAAAQGVTADLPAGVEQRLIFDQSAYTSRRLSELAANLAIGVGLIVLVLLVSLGLRAALVVASAVPVVAMISLFVMDAAGIAIHQMSVTGMIVALGLLVDAAIVTTDEVRKRIAAREDRAAAIRGAVRLLAVPLGASTLTTVLAFLPMATLPGAVGDFIGTIAQAVIIMLASSLAVALVLLPALAGWVLPAPRPDLPQRWWRDGVAAPRLGQAFGWSIGLSLAHPWMALAAALALPVLGFLSFPTLTSQFFPGADRDQFHVQVTLPGGASIGRTDAAVATADALLRGTEGIRAVAWVVGESAPAFYYNMTADQDGNAGFAEALVTTVSASETARLIPALQRALDAGLPQGQVVVRELVQGPPVGAPVELRFVGPDLEVLRALGDRAQAVMASVPEVTLTRASLGGGAPKLVLDLDEDRLAQAGLTLADAAGQLAGGFDGATGGTLVEGTVQSPVRVRIAGPQRAAAGDVAGFDLLAGRGAGAGQGAQGYAGLPLDAFGTARLVPSESPINRRNGERVNTVQGFVAFGVLPEEALAQVRARLAAIPDLLPAGYRLEIGGDSDARGDTVTDLLATVGIVAALTLATLALSLGSFRLMAVALVVCLLSAGLSILALAVFRYPFGVTALIGVIGSVGVSINAAIIVLSGLRADARAMAGDLEAMREVVTGSGRHILSTTITTFGGFLPLILSGGGFWPPFAMAVAGGVLLSTVVSFYFTPPAFALLMRPRRARAPAPVASVA